MFYSGKLKNQEVLCSELRRYPAFAIDSDHENPMSIRLIATHDALNDIGKAVRQANHFAEQMGLQAPPLSTDASWFNKLHKTTPLSGAGFKMPQFREPNAGKKLKAHLAELNKHLYSFYVNGGACLDRLGWELNRVYGLGRAVGFGTIDKQKDQRPNQLFDSQNYTDAVNFMAYQRCIVRDRVMPLEVRDQVYLPDGFDEGCRPTGFNQKPVGLCKRQFAAIESLIDLAYRMMWEEYQATKQLPLTSNWPK